MTKLGKHSYSIAAIIVMLLIALLILTDKSMVSDSSQAFAELRDSLINSKAICIPHQNKGDRLLIKTHNKQYSAFRAEESDAVSPGDSVLITDVYASPDETGDMKIKFVYIKKIDAE